MQCATCGREVLIECLEIRRRRDRNGFFWPSCEVTREGAKCPLLQMQLFSGFERLGFELSVVQFGEIFVVIGHDTTVPIPG